MPLIEPHGAEKWWSPESLREMNFKEDENPYDVPDDHPAAKLQITTKAVKEWIFALRVDPVTKGVHLAKMWKRILLRRTFSSQVPFNDGRKISDQLPRVQGALINCTHTPTEQTVYQKMEDALTGKLIVAGSGSTNQRKPKWSLGIHRQLSLLSMWSGLPQLDNDFNLKATNMKATLERKSFYMDFQGPGG